jgi:hypothetical protein
MAVLEDATTVAALEMVMVVAMIVVPLATELVTIVELDIGSKDVVEEAATADEEDETEDKEVSEDSVLLILVNTEVAIVIRVLVEEGAPVLIGEVEAVEDVEVTAAPVESVELVTAALVGGVELVKAPVETVKFVGRALETV